MKPILILMLLLLPLWTAAQRTSRYERAIERIQLSHMTGESLLVQRYDLSYTSMDYVSGQFTSTYIVFTRSGRSIRISRTVIPLVYPLIYPQGITKLLVIPNSSRNMSEAYWNGRRIIESILNPKQK